MLSSYLLVRHADRIGGGVEEEEEEGGGAAASSNQAEVAHAEAIRLGAPPIDDAWVTPGLVGPFVLTFGLHCTFQTSPIPTKC